MIQLKCANDQCGRIIELERIPKKYCCPDCGILNTPQPQTTGTGESACGCLMPEGFEFLEPAGEFDVSVTEANLEGKLYATADDATKLTTQEWIVAFGCHPQITRDWMKKLGIEGKPGFVNLSTLGRKR